MKAKTYFSIQFFILLAGILTFCFVPLNIGHYLMCSEAALSLVITFIAIDKKKV
jgi:hypothetical protein